MGKAQKTLILGGKTGLLGKALQEVLQKNGWETIVTGDSSELNLAGANVSDRLASLLDTHEPDVVFNTVAYTRVDDAETEIELATALNHRLPALLGRLVKERGSTLVHYSTDFVFNGKKERPYTTEDVPDPQSVYGKTKLAGEQAILLLAYQKAMVLRTAWLFGPGRKNFVNTILSKCDGGGVLNVVGDQIGSPSYSMDVAKYSMLLVNASASGLFHVVNSGAATWCDLATEAVRLSLKGCTVNSILSSAYPQKAQRPSYSVLDTESLVRATGMTPRPWAQALAEYIFRELPLEG